MVKGYDDISNQLSNQQYTWLITGVAGFIGSNLLHALLRFNQVVIGLDNFSTGHRKNIQSALAPLTDKQKRQFTFYEGDICTMDDCIKAIHGVDYVLHQAALGSVPRSIKHPEQTHQTNTLGFINLLKGACEHRIKRFIYASSSSVYGDAKALPKLEDQIGKPLSPYAVSKVTDELYAHVFSHCYGIQTIGLRYFNVFGPHQDPDGSYAAVIPRWIKHILCDEEVVIYGDGETSRDFCYIDNVIQANLLAAMTDNTDAINTVYNIAVGEQHTLNTLFQYMTEALGCKGYSKVRHDDFRAGDIRHSLASIEKAKHILGYRPTHTLREGLQIMMDWYQSSCMPILKANKKIEY